MSTIIAYIQRPAVFDPETISVMDDAYKRALESLPASTPKSVRELIASRIITMVRLGERNPGKLCEESLAALNVLSDCK